MTPNEPAIRLSSAEVAEWRQRHWLVARSDAVFRVEGPGTTDCLQGIFTNDIVAAGERALIWGAILTPKGMIVTDAWVKRDGAAAWLIVPGEARAVTQQLLGRSFPPRLARVTDRTHDVAVRWLLGDGVAAAETDLFVPAGPAPFTALVISSDPAVTDTRLLRQGWRFAPPAFADATKVLMGWPTLGREIDEKCLPQEVRFDELEAVKYDKGCYTGQETVARVHFRGHVNRLLRGLEWEAGEPRGDDVVVGGKSVGTVRTTLRFGSRMLALASLRREIAIGEKVIAGEADATVISLPIDPQISAAA